LKGQLHQGIGKHIQQQWTGFAAGFAAGVAAGVAAVALIDLGTALKLKGQLHQGIGKHNQQQ
jgi:hypothetical protein